MRDNTSTCTVPLEGAHVVNLYSCLPSVNSTDCVLVNAASPAAALADAAAAADKEADAKAESFLHVPSLPPAQAVRAVPATSSQFAIDSSKAPAPTDDATSLPRAAPDMSPAPSQTSLAAAVGAALGGPSTSAIAGPASGAQLSTSASPEAASAGPGNAVCQSVVVLFLVWSVDVSVNVNISITSGASGVQMSISPHLRVHFGLLNCWTQDKTCCSACMRSAP